MNKLAYSLNLRRGEICEIDFQTIKLTTSITQYVLGIYSEYLQTECTAEHLYLVLEELFLPFSEERLLSNPDAKILYSVAIAPQNAFAYDEYDGILFFFHTNEGNHREYPHVHAKHSGDEISIYLNDYSIIGDFKNRSKKRKAISYVKEHHEKLLIEWNRIIGV